MQRALHEIFDRWDGGGVPDGRRGQAITLPARVAQVATLAVLLEKVVGRDAAFDVLGRRAGGQLDPALSSAFVQEGPELLQEMAGADVWQAVLEAEPSPHETDAEHGVDTIASTFVDLVDLKTPFTPGHASGVARNVSMRRSAIPLTTLRVTLLSSRVMH